MSDEWSSEERHVYESCHEALVYGEIITRDLAMTVAAWWHSPGSPNSTLLSTMGKVACNADISDFASAVEFDKQDIWGKWALNALAAFIKDAREKGHVTHLPGCKHDNG